jgi:hypothetical protein
MLLVKQLVGHPINIIKHAIGQKNPCKSLEISMRKGLQMIKI